MKIEDISKVLGNIDERHVKEAMNYKPKHNRSARWIALAACIAVIVTSIPLAFILNREDASEDGDVHQETHNHEENIEDVLKGYGNLQLSNGSLNLNTIQLSDGKINKDRDMTVQDKYVYDYTPVDKHKLLDEMILRALPYHGLTEIEDAYINTNYVKNSRYSIRVNQDIVETRVYSTGGYNLGKHFLNIQLNKSNVKPRVIKFPYNANFESIYAAFKPQIDLLNNLLVCDLNSCYAELVPEESIYSVYFWDSSDEEMVKIITRKIQDIASQEGRDAQKVGLDALTLRVDFELNGGYVEKIRVNDFRPVIYTIAYEGNEAEILDFLSVEISKRYIIKSNEEEFLNCALDLEQYLIDVWRIAGLENSYTLDIKDPLTDKYSNITDSNNYFGITKRAIFKVAVTPTPGHSEDYIEFVFYSVDGETYVLSEIKSKYSLGGDDYIELITPEEAIEQLASGYAIGDVGQGCYICREKYLPEIIEFINNNMTYELVKLSGIEFKMSEGKVLYDMPFYKFTSKPDAEGVSYISYVIAVESGYNIKFDLGELKEIVYEHNLSQCPNAADHPKIEREKKKRTETLKDEFVKEYLKANPDAFKSTAMKIANEKYKW